MKRIWRHGRTRCNGRGRHGRFTLWSVVSTCVGCRQGLVRRSLQGHGSCGYWFDAVGSMVDMLLDYCPWSFVRDPSLLGAREKRVRRLCWSEGQWGKRTELWNHLYCSCLRKAKIQSPSRTALEGFSDIYLYAPSRLEMFDEAHDAKKALKGFVETIHVYSRAPKLLNCISQSYGPQTISLCDRNLYHKVLQSSITVLELLYQNVVQQKWASQVMSPKVKLRAQCGNFVNRRQSTAMSILWQKTICGCSLLETCVQ